MGLEHSSRGRIQYFRAEHSSQKRIIGDEALFPGEDTVSVGGALFPVSMVEYLFVEYSFQWRISRISKVEHLGGYRDWEHLKEGSRQLIFYRVIGK